ncbi:MAG: hypothetical protein OZ928_08080 [Polyangiaceae bacterium]|nr:hypothetical protein [Polyangiaceae bacterium]
MLDVNPYADHVAARFLDFFGRATRWQRGLWSVGLILTLREVLEASEAVREGVLSQDALKYLLDHARRLAGPDPGVGEEPRRKSLLACLAGDLAYKGHDFRVLRQTVPELEENYLDRWAVALRRSAPPTGPERAARAIAAHLLDAGLHPNFLHRWITYRIAREPGQRSLADVIADAHGLVRASPRTYDVVVAFTAAPKPFDGPAWIDAASLAQWLDVKGLQTRKVRQYGGVRLRVSARDPWSAVDDAGERVDRMAALGAIGTRGTRLVAHPVAWVEGKSGTYPLRSRRRVEVLALTRETRLGGVERVDIVDAALELLGPLDTGPAGPAVASGWAAVEAVLTMPGDRQRVLAADRLASLVACSWPRAELTTLAYAHQTNARDELATRLGACTENRERAVLTAEALSAGEALKVVHGSDQAARDRMTRFLASRRTCLLDVQEHATAAIRRLYRQRNLVLHGGRVGAVALRAALRTAAPLVGAGFDRIAHAWYVKGVEPRDLAARARLRIDQADLPGRSVAELLE